MIEFERGDVVRLKSGGPAMTIGEQRFNNYLCKWIGCNEPYEEEYHADMLVPLEEEFNAKGPQE